MPKLTTSKIVLGSSAIILAASGLALTFFPDELAENINLPDDASVKLLIQTIGAMYFGFAMLNWMSRRSLIGGIYNRPIAIANMTHFMMVGIALTKLMLNKALPQSFWLVTLIYLVYALIFGWLLFTTPNLGQKAA
jgi:ABC-type multidrug transport system permease subunit